MPESPATKTVRAKDCQFSIGDHSPGKMAREKRVSWFHSSKAVSRYRPRMTWMLSSMNPHALTFLNSIDAETCPAHL